MSRHCPRHHSRFLPWPECQTRKAYRLRSGLTSTILSLHTHPTSATENPPLLTTSESLTHIARDQLLVQLAECLESLSERTILGVSARGCVSICYVPRGKECVAEASTHAGAYERRNALEYDAQRILVPSHPLIFDDTRVRQLLDEVDLSHQL